MNEQIMRFASERYEDLLRKGNEHALRDGWYILRVEGTEGGVLVTLSNHDWSAIDDHKSFADWMGAGETLTVTCDWCKWDLLRPLQLAVGGARAAKIIDPYAVAPAAGV